VSEHGLRVLHLASNRWWTGSADPIIQLVGGSLDIGDFLAHL